ncbi:dephospho-CoA kinase [Miniphocaeibacter massiliensis]|uniref:dephospho-CoA kinase n=1 Tax=Miniphocaeibacter massiliensis TaxID=2041841 RepID=UPI000C1C06DA|nr:dephospho-CoA kinase [Miniphocaeibacter massiliensis]
MWEIVGMIQNKKIYFIIGSIASGKSSVVKILKEKGFLTIESDKIVHLLYEEKEVQEKLASCFGKEIIKDNKIDRKKLGDIVYNDELKKKKLECEVHPLVMDRVYEIIKSSNKDIIFIELPLYYKVEKIIQKHIANYKIIFINVKEEIQIKRLIKRNDISRAKAKHLMYNIKNIMSFEKSIDYIIENNYDFVNLKKQVNEILKMERLNEDS